MLKICLIFSNKIGKKNYFSVLTFVFPYLASLVAQRLKCLPAMWETWVRSLGWEDPLEKEMATHSKYSGLGNPMDRGAWRATVYGAAKSRT